MSLPRSTSVTRCASIAWPSPASSAIRAICARGRARRPISANALERLGVSVEAIRPRMSRLAKWGIAACDMLAGLGRPLSSEQVLRGLTVAPQARRTGGRGRAQPRRAARASYRHLRSAGVRPRERRRSITSTATTAGRWRRPITSMPGGTPSGRMAAFEQAEREALARAGPRLHLRRLCPRQSDRALRPAARPRDRRRLRHGRHRAV